MGGGISAEDRITKIKNLLFALTQNQVKAEALTTIRYEQAQERDANVDNETAALRESLDRQIEFVAKAMDRTDRPLAESANQIAATSAAQEATELQLQKFINKVDGIGDRFTSWKRRSREDHHLRLRLVQGRKH